METSAPVCKLCQSRSLEGVSYTDFDTADSYIHSWLHSTNSNKDEDASVLVAEVEEKH